VGQRGEVVCRRGVVGGGEESGQGMGLDQWRLIK